MEKSGHQQNKGLKVLNLVEKLRKPKPRLFRMTPACVHVHRRTLQHWGSQPPKHRPLERLASPAGSPSGSWSLFIPPVAWNHSPQQCVLPTPGQTCQPRPCWSPPRLCPGPDAQFMSVTLEPNPTWATNSKALSSLFASEASVTWGTEPPWGM